MRRHRRRQKPTEGPRAVKSSIQWQGLAWQWILPAAFFCLGLAYLYASPHFEASDSDEHVGMIQWLAETGRLPVQTAEHDALYGQEASQPPLYYALMALIWRSMDTSDFDSVYQENPLAINGDPHRLGSRNLVFYRQPYPPYLHGTSLALYVIRLATLCMGAVTVYAVYQSARIVLPGSPDFAVLATSLVAFNPMFVFIGASISNDPPVSMLAALICWRALLMLRDGFDTRRSLVLALLIALATLTKLSGIVPGFAAGLAALWLAGRGKDWRGLIALSLAVLVIWLAVAGWWYARNLQLYGELFGTGSMLDFYGRRTITLGGLVLEEFEGLRISYWGLFGAFSILAHKAYYLAMDLLSLLGVLGLPLALRSPGRSANLRPMAAFLGLVLALGGAMLIWWSIQTTASTGRLLFPYITSISILLALGLNALRIPSPVIGLPLFAFTLACPFVYIKPQYEHPHIVAELPESANPTFAQWDDITLIGYEIPEPRRWSAGDEIPLTLYWRPLAKSGELQALFITLIDAEGEALATIDSFPGWGTLPSTWWQPGSIYRDDYILQIPPDVQAVSSVQLHIGWYNWADRRNIMPRGEADKEQAAFTVPIGAIATGELQQTLGLDATRHGDVFGDALKLHGYDFSAGHTLQMEWQIVNALAGDWRAFAIVLDKPYQEGADFEIILQRDATPSLPLGFLKAGETVITRHEFQLPAGYSGQHGIYVGWYNEALGMRLAAPFPQNMLELPAMPFVADGA